MTLAALVPMNVVMKPGRLTWFRNVTLSTRQLRVAGPRPESRTAKGNNTYAGMG